MSLELPRKISQELGERVSVELILRGQGPGEMCLVLVPPTDGRRPPFSPREFPSSQALLQEGERESAPPDPFSLPSRAIACTIPHAPIINIPDFSFSLEFLLSSVRCYSRCY